MSAQPEITQVGDLIAFIILFYDQLLTFPAEVRHLWRRPCFNLGFVLFFITRYSALSVHILNVTQVFTTKRSADNPAKENNGSFSCYPVQIVVGVGLLIIQLFCAAIMAMRVYALYGKSRLVLASVCIVAVAVLVFSIWALFLAPRGMNEDTNIARCVDRVTSTMSLQLAIAWGGQMVYDAVIFLLTVWRSYSIGRVGDRSLVDILLRDGSIYFAIISCANAANIVILLLATPPYKAVTGIFTNSLTVIMVLRLMINVQEPARRRSEGNNELTTVVLFDDLSPDDSVPDQLAEGVRWRCEEEIIGDGGEGVSA